MLFFSVKSQIILTVATPFIGSPLCKFVLLIKMFITETEHVSTIYFVLSCYFLFRFVHVPTKQTNKK